MRSALLQGVGLSPREDHIDALFSRYDRGGGAFDYMSFLKAIVPRAIAENVSFLQTFFDERPKVVRKVSERCRTLKQSHVSCFVLRCIHVGG